VGVEEEEVGWWKASRNGKCGDAGGKTSYVEMRQVGQ